MEEKYNEATRQRPEGNRPLDAPFIPINIHKYVAQIKSEEAYDKNGKNAITVFKSTEVTITIVALKKDEMIRPGNEENEAIMSLQLISGQLFFESMGNEITVSDGELLTLHQQLSFKAKALMDSICLLTIVK